MVRGGERLFLPSGEETGLEGQLTSPGLACTWQ